ncbi:MAG: RNA methyltransferase [Saprospiraceae bacterium]
MSISTNQIKYIASLQSKKFRKKYGKFIVEGEKPVKEALDHFHNYIDHIYLLEESAELYEGHPNLDPKLLSLINNKELSRISGLKTPNKVLVVCDIPEDDAIQKPVENYQLYLDQINDPGNFGTIVRIADWFGLKQVFVSPECAEVWNPKVIQSSMGAVFRVKVIEENLKELTEKWPEIPVLVSDMDGIDIFKTKEISGGWIVIGNESHGVSQEIRNLPHQKISIPKGEGSQMESLNAAVASGILLAGLIHKS